MCLSGCVGLPESVAAHGPCVFKAQMWNRCFCLILLLSTTLPAGLDARRGNGLSPNGKTSEAPRRGCGEREGTTEVILALAPSELDWNRGCMISEL